KPDDEVRKGEKIEDDKGFYDRDMLQYEVQFGDDIEMTDALEKLIFKLYPFRGYISEIASEYDIKLSVFIDSFSHEIFFTLPKNITKELKEFNIDFEIMLYSPR
ncbi:MAG: DUF4279 domain-containing protein, partial [Bacillota bacterium]|nr:DUF4279 domain-containing protein [Bacillota bacterium]